MHGVGCLSMGIGHQYIVVRHSSMGIGQLHVGIGMGHLGMGVGPYMYVYNENDQFSVWQQCLSLNVCFVQVCQVTLCSPAC